MTTTSLIVLSNPTPTPNLPEYPSDKPLKNLLTKGSSNTKLAKNDTPTWALSLAQHNLSGHNVCPHATAGCIAACVGSCGLASVFGTVMAARIRKTRAFFSRRAEFVSRVERELGNAVKWLEKRGHAAGVVRLNTFSDIGWEGILNLGSFRTLRFYDYTKSMKRAMAAAAGTGLYDNYRLCYSVNEHSDMEQVKALLRAGGTAAVVLDVRYVNKDNKDEMPTSFMGFPMIDGDAKDDRSSDPRGCFVGLRLKGTKAKRADAIRCGFARKPD